MARGHENLLVLMLLLLLLLLVLLLLLLLQKRSSKNLYMQCTSQNLYVAFRFEVLECIGEKTKQNQFWLP